MPNEDVRSDCFIWCLHCERVYAGVNSEDGKCPYCDAMTITDGWLWSLLVELNGYATEPVLGKYYPLYP